MEYRHEIVHFSNQVPGKIFLHRLGSVPKHWHRSIEVLFVLSGEIQVIVDNHTYHLQATDVIVINSLSIHELYSQGAELVAFQTNLTKSPFGETMSDCYFHCCSAGDTTNVQYNRLRNLLARLIKENSDQENVLLSYSLIAQLLHELKDNFSVPQPENILCRSGALSQMSQVTDYMLQHFREGLSLQSVAAHFHYSAPYLSRFFKQNINVTFLDFYTGIRLESAVNDLLTSKDSINMIAANNGFSSARSFVAAFQKRYRMLPSEYRATQPSMIPQGKALNEVNYLAVTTSNSLSSLAAFLDAPKEPSEARKKAVKQTVGPVNCTQKAKYLHHNWRSLCCVGSSRDLLYADVQEMVKRLQRDMPFRFVKFHGVLSDDLMLYDELPDGTVSLSFTLLDKLLDFLQSVGLKPLMQLSFMPRALASEPERTSFFTRQNCSPPKDMEKWVFFISELVRHCIRRYSVEEVMTWPFCVWNEPDTTPEMFGFRDKGVFFYFYERTFKAIKAVNPDLTVGSPSLLFLLDDPLDWYRPFFHYCQDHDCMPEFFNFHFYNDDITLDTECGSAKKREKVINKLDPDPNAFRTFLDGMGQRMEEYGIEGLPVYLTEWNLTVSHRNLINDTCFKSCYLVKNLLENYDRLASFGYWSVTDLIGEAQLPDRLFHGGLGMFTVNGIPKAHYYAFRMLTRLGDILVASGEGWFLTRHSGSQKLSLALYNYCHYNQLISAGEVFDMTATDRYTVFPGMKAKQFSVHLEGLAAPSYTVRETFVNRSHGSSYDTWVDMGGMEPKNSDDLDLLARNSLPGRHLFRLSVRDGSASYSCRMEPLEVRLVEFEPNEKDDIM